MTKDNNKPVKKDKRILTLFLVLMPSILITGNYGMSFAGSIAFKVILIFYQFVILKNILDDYYSYVE